MVKKKKKKFRFKRFLLLLLTILLFACVIYSLSLIKPKSYLVYNNTYLNDEEVLNELKLDKNDSFLLVNSFSLKEFVKKSDLIKEIKISKTLSLNIKVKITEYKVLYYDNKSNRTILENGKEISYKNNNVPVLINEISDKEVKKNFIKKLNKVDDTILSSVSEIIYSPNGIDKERFLFSMNDGNYVYVTISKLTKINEYRSVIDSVENKKGILYLDYGNYFVPKEN